jgi:acetyl-CoA carboxylase carboxyltransferase component
MERARSYSQWIVNGKISREETLGIEEVVKELYLRREEAKQMGGEEKVRRQHALGRLTARERIDRLTDPGSFQELGLLNTSDMPGMAEKTPADGRVCGFGLIDGRKVAVVAADVTVLGGSGGRISTAKMRNLVRMATERGYPVIQLGDEIGGARLPDFMGATGIGRNVRTFDPSLTAWEVTRQTPSVAAIMGECFGEPSWNVAQADFAVMVKGTAMGAVGPRFIEGGTGAKVTPQEIGGWEIHADFTGQIDTFAENEEECLGLIRRFLSYMPSHNGEEPPYALTQDDPHRRLEDVDMIVPDQLRRGYDMHRLLEVIVDDGEYFPLQAEFGKSTITCLARIGGRVVGIVASNPLFNAGAPDIPACEKLTHFLCLCDSFNIPLVFIQDVPGMLPGKNAEKLKLPTKVVVLLQAIGMTTVPKVGVTLRKAYGIGWRCVGASQTDIQAVWPTASISFVDPEVGVDLVYRHKIAEAQHPEAERQQLLREWAVVTAPWELAGISDLEVIDPKDTRRFIAESMDTLRGYKGNTIGKHRLANWPTGF